MPRFFPQTIENIFCICVPLYPQGCSLRDLEKQIDDKNPVKAVEFIKAHHLSGHILNEYLYGGYLIWALPNKPVFIDGRGDIFEWSGVLDEFSKWVTLQSNPNELLDKYRVDFCLLSLDSPMARVLPLLPGWKEIYSDHVSVIFARSAPSSSVN